MANTFKNKTFDGSSTAANSDMIPYTAPSSTTTVVIGLTIANIHPPRLLLILNLMHKPISFFRRTLLYQQVPHLNNRVEKKLFFQQDIR